MKAPSEYGRPIPVAMASLMIRFVKCTTSTPVVKPSTFLHNIKSLVNLETYYIVCVHV